MDARKPGVRSYRSLVLTAKEGGGYGTIVNGGN